MADTNPFASLLTPARLEQARDAEFAQKYANADPWTRMAAEAGHKIAKAERAAGRGLTEEDIIAQRNENIMAGAQSRYGELIKTGKMSPDEAQAEALQEAIAGFAANGSWEQALALTQPLNALRTQALERRKLKAEAVFQETRPDVELEKAAATTTRAEVAQQLADLRVAVAQAKTETEVAKMRADIARLEAMAAWYQRKDMEGPGEKGPAADDSVFAKKQRVTTNEAVMGAAAAVNLMTTIKTIGLENPRVLTAAGPIITQLTTVAEGAKALMQGNGYEPEKDAAKFTRLIKDNIADQRLQAVTLDLAFAFARVRDPGGRLSNQDVEKAIEIVSGRGSPQARMATLDQALAHMDKQIRSTIKIKESEGYGPTQEAVTLYEEALAGYKGTGAKPKEGEADKDGWVTLPNGVRVREKK